MNPFLATDGYKTGHHLMYPQGTSLVYSNFTPRSAKHAPPGITKVVSFGQQLVMKQIEEMFLKDFFGGTKGAMIRSEYKRLLKGDIMNLNVESQYHKLRDKYCKPIEKEYSEYLNAPYDISHIESLWDLGYLPIQVRALEEGTLVPIGVPVLTIHNTLPEFYWLTNFLETLISNLLWKPMTSATIAHQYKQNLLEWAKKTDKENLAFVEFQGHDFSMRGMDSIGATISSGLGHAASFLGSDSLPVIHGARKYYNEDNFVVGSVNATEHSVMCAGGDKDELNTFRYLMDQFPTGILSIVSDTWDLWRVVDEFLPKLKDEIMSREGKIVIRPDSGDPVDIICGCKHNGRFINKAGEVEGFFDPVTFKYRSFKTPRNRHEYKGVIELLWDIFGGTINSQGYKVLDPHIGAIYGDSITIQRAEEICQRLAEKGFASTNIVLGIGSFTYQYNTRDTFGFAMKATYVEINGDCMAVTEDEGNMGHPSNRCPDCTCYQGKEIFKDPVTDDGTKKSAKGLLAVWKDFDRGYWLQDQVTWQKAQTSELGLIYNNGVFYNEVTLSEIRDTLSKQ